MPFNHHLGLRVTRLFKDGLALECAFRPEMGNWLGTLHGGVTAALVDISIGMAVIAHSGGCRVSTVELKTNYLRPAVDGPFRCRARLIKTGRTLVFGETVIRDARSRVVATGTATYIYLDPGDES
jgi:uncharacterized protein (TIGR00369 family)